MASAGAQQISKAADLIEPRGCWRQGSFGKGGLPTCMAGACNMAAGRRPSDYGFAGTALLRFLSEHLGENVVIWNDAPGRTQAEVVAKLRELAVLYDARVSA